jgi:hypothetical protein
MAMAQWKVDSVHDSSDGAANAMIGRVPGAVLVTWHYNGKFSVIFDISVPTNPNVKWDVKSADSNAHLEQALNVTLVGEAVIVCGGNGFRIFHTT